MSQLDGVPKSIDRVLTDEDMEDLGAMIVEETGIPVEPGPVRPRDEAGLIGGLGTCGRTLRCLSYENEQYKKAKQSLPRLGQTITTADGEGVVVSLQVPKELVTVRYENPDREETYPAAELLPPGKLPDPDRTRDAAQES